MLLLSRGLVVSFRDLLDSVGFDVRVTATDSPLPGGIRMKDATAAAAAVARLPGIAEVVPMRTASGEIVLPGGRVAPAFSLTGMDPGTRRPWTIVAGQRLATPRPPPGIVMNQPLMDAAGMPLGSELRCGVGCDSSRAAPLPRPFTLLGVAQFPFDDEAQHTAVMTPRSAAGRLRRRTRRGRHADGRIERRVRLAPWPQSGPRNRSCSDHQRADRRAHAGAGIHLLPADLDRALDDHAALRFPADHRAADRLGESAARRNRGAARARLLARPRCGGCVVRRARCSSAPAACSALPLGMALSVWLDRILKAMPGIPAAMHFFVFEPRALVLHAALLVATALLASAYPMWLVARLPIAATLRNEVVG